MKYKKIDLSSLYPKFHYIIIKIAYSKKCIPKSLKRSVWDKYIGANIGLTKCLCCKHQSIRQIEFHCAHIISEKNGGTTTLNNLIPICAQCNFSMRTKNLSEFKNKYFKNNMNNMKNNMQIQTFYPKRIRKQIDNGPSLNSSLIDFRKNTF